MTKKKNIRTLTSSVNITKLFSSLFHAMLNVVNLSVVVPFDSVYELTNVRYPLQVHIIAFYSM